MMAYRRFQNTISGIAQSSNAGYRESIDNITDEAPHTQFENSSNTPGGNHLPNNLLEDSPRNSVEGEFNRLSAENPQPENGGQEESPITDPPKVMSEFDAFKLSNFSTNWVYTIWSTNKYVICADSFPLQNENPN